MINFERVDPHIMKQIRDQTLQEIVHTKPETTVIRKEENQEKHYPIDVWKLKKRIKRYNGLLKRHHVNIFLEVAGEQELFIRILERDTGKLMRIFNDEEVEELLMKLENFIGLFIDHRI